jgi:hypothetical protein
VTCWTIRRWQGSPLIPAGSVPFISVSKIANTYADKARAVHSESLTLDGLEFDVNAPHKPGWKFDSIIKASNGDLYHISFNKNGSLKNFKQ